MRWLFPFVASGLVACGSAPPKPVVKPVGDPKGPHAGAITGQLQPYIDAQLLRGVVVGVYDAGKREVYGFGVGPNGAPPTGDTLFELGSITKIYTALMLADSVQRKEMELDQPVAELLPPGATVPGKDQRVITLKELALHGSGLPRLPPSLDPNLADPYALYNADALYKDLASAQLETAPGMKIAYSNWGFGLLGFAVAHKLGGHYAEVLKRRVLDPLKLTSTYFAVPAEQGTPPIPKADLEQGSTDDLVDAAAWHADALAGAGALVSSANDQLSLIEAELDADAGGKLPLRRAMRLTQEPQMETQVGETGPNAGLGWQIDADGRYWHNGQTGGFHSFITFDPKARRGIVVLAATATTLVDAIPGRIYSVLDNQVPTPPKFPSPRDLIQFAGQYDLAGTKVAVVAEDKRLYIQAPNEPRARLLPLSDHEFLIEAIQAAVVFEREADGKIARFVLVVGQQQVNAQRVDPDAPPVPAP
ncbi:MAG TPA: serine hydrolase [Kofleriaceae bacterium]|jgi:CubicO group peptidase (beta-lactamase class C family)